MEERILQSYIVLTFLFVFVGRFPIAVAEIVILNSNVSDSIKYTSDYPSAKAWKRSSSKHQEEQSH